MKNVNIWDAPMFLDRIEFFATNKGMSLRQLCLESELDDTYFLKIKERGTLPSLSSICKICDTLGISLFVFFNIADVIYPEDAIVLSAFNEMSDESRSVLALLVKQLK